MMQLALLLFVLCFASCYCFTLDVRKNYPSFNKATQSLYTKRSRDFFEGKTSRVVCFSKNLDQEQIDGSDSTNFFVESTAIRLPLDFHMYDMYDELAKHLVSKAQDSARQDDSPTATQIWVGVAGPPGSGKSTIASEVCKRVLDSGVGCVVVPMDGFHLTRAQLDQMEDPQEAHARRGAPFTFDPRGLLERIRETRRNGRGLFPSFDHGVGDPVEDDVEVTRDHKIVIVEGNYVLLDGVEVWEEISSCFDETWAVKCSIETIRERIIKRHMITGDTHERAMKRADNNDVLNAKLVLNNYCPSDKIIDLDLCKVSQG